MGFITSKDKLTKIALSIIISVAAALRLYRLSFHSFWGDEILNINWPQLPSVRAIIDFLGPGDTSPPFYYLFMHFWIKLGLGEFIVRLPSAIAGVLTVFVVFKLAEALFGRRIGLLSAALVAVSPFYLWISQEARMYSFLGLFCISSLYFFIDAIKTNKKSSWLSYVILSVLAFYTHYYAVFTIFAEFLYFIVLVPKNRKIILGYIASSFSIILLLLPLFSFLGVQKAHSTRIAWKLFLSTVWSVPHAFFAFSAGSSLLQVELTTFSRAIFSNTLLILIVTLFFAPVFIAGVIYLATKVKKINPVLFYFFIPLLTSYFVSWKIPLFGSKYLVAAVTCYYIILAFGLLSFRRGIAMFLLAGILSVNAVSIYNYYFNDKFAKAPWREFVDFARRHEKEGDVYIFTSFGLSEPFEHYYRGQIPRYAGLDKIFSIRPDLGNLLEKYDRVWFIPDNQRVFDPKDSVREYLNSNARLESEYEIRGMKFSLFKVQSGSNKTDKQVHRTGE